MGDIGFPRQQAENATIGVYIATDNVLHLTDDIMVPQSGEITSPIAFFRLQHHYKQALLLQRMLYLHIVCVMKASRHH